MATTLLLIQAGHQRPQRKSVMLQEPFFLARVPALAEDFFFCYKKKKKVTKGKQNKQNTGNTAVLAKMMYLLTGVFSDGCFCPIDLIKRMKNIFTSQLFSDKFGSGCTGQPLPAFSDQPCHWFFYYISILLGWEASAPQPLSCTRLCHTIQQGSNRRLSPSHTRARDPDAISLFRTVNYWHKSPKSWSQDR